MKSNHHFNFYFFYWHGQIESVQYCKKYQIHYQFCTFSYLFVKKWMRKNCQLKVWQAHSGYVAIITCPHKKYISPFFPIKTTSHSEYSKVITKNPCKLLIINEIFGLVKICFSEPWCKIKPTECGKKLLLTVDSCVCK